MADKYDDMDWHEDDELIEELGESAAATHMGMFAAWCLLNSLGTDRPEIQAHLPKLASRQTTPGSFLEEYLDGKLTGNCLSGEGADFASAYYAAPAGQASYLDEYAALLGEEHGGMLAVPDTWQNYDVVAGMIAARHAQWVKAGRPGSLPA